MGWAEIVDLVLAILGGGMVLVSYIPKDQLKLRKINLIACMLFVAFGIFDLAVYEFRIMPLVTLLLNASCGIVHIVYLFTYYYNVAKSKRSNKKGE